MPSFRVSVTRPLDLDRFTDRLAMGSLFAFGAAGYLRGGWAEAVQAGLAAYLSWALCREIDPDHPVTANLAAVAGGALALALQTHAGVLFVMLLAVKVMVGGSGLSPVRWEAGVLGAAAMVFAGTPAGWWAALATAAALFLDTAMQPPAAPVHRFVAGGLALGASVVHLMLAGPGPWWWIHAAAVAAAALVLSYTRFDLYKRSRIALGAPAAAALATAIVRVAGEGAGAGPWWMYLLMGGGLVSGAALSFLRTAVVSPTDHAEHPIPAERVETARLLAAAFLVVSCFSVSGGGLAGAAEPAAPLWAALILVGVREAVHRAGRRTPGNAP